MADTMFSEIDLNKKGGVSSEYPSWYYTEFENELKEGIAYKKNMLANDLVPKSEVGITRARLEAEEDKLTKLKDARPRFKGAEKDKIAKAREELGQKISGAMFSRSDMKKGTADAHEEARRMVEPIIECPADLAKMCNVQRTGGKVSRTGAEKIWKILGRVLDEGSNTELLRKD